MRGKDFDMGKKAVVAGHICLDITPVFSDNVTKAAELGEILKPGKLINMSAPDVHTGGAVANTGLGMKKLGADVKLAGKVGNDAFGGIVSDILKKHGLCDDLIVEEGAITSYSVIVAVPGIDRIFLHCPGANDTFDGTEISDEILDDTALFHFGYPTLMKKMYEDEGEHLSDLMRRMKKKDIATGLDMAAVDPESEAAAADWEIILKKTLPFVDFFMPSFEELCFMLDRSKYENLLHQAGNSDMTGLLSIEDDIRPLACKCIELGAKSVLLKCGAPGMYYQASDNMSEVGKRLELDEDAWNGFNGFERSFKIDKVLSGTGAGDTCIAAFLTSILEGAGPKEAMENAAGAGALCCTAYDAVSGLQKLSAIRKKIDSGWEKNEKQS